MKWCSTKLLGAVQMAGASQHIARPRRRFPLLIRIALVIAAAVLLADNARLRRRLEQLPRSIGEPSHSSAGSFTGETAHDRVNVHWVVTIVALLLAWSIGNPADSVMSFH